MQAGGNGTGDIGGWTITDTTLQSASFYGRVGITLDSANSKIIIGEYRGAIYSGWYSELSSSVPGFYLTYAGLSMISTNELGEPQGRLEIMIKSKDI